MADGPLKTPEFASDTTEPEVARQVQVTRMKQAHVSQPEDRHVTRPAALPFLLDDDMLQVTNDDGKTWDFRWGGKHYVIEPGQTKFVIFQALVDALGDPRSADNVVTKYNDGAGNRGIISARYDELRRLMARYGIRNERIDPGMPDATKDDDGSGLLSRTPKVRVWTLQGEPVAFPGLRPDMMHFPVPMVDERAVNSDMTRWAQGLEAENAELKTRLDRMESLVERSLAEREGHLPEGD